MFLSFKTKRASTTRGEKAHYAQKTSRWSWQEREVIYNIILVQTFNLSLHSHVQNRMFPHCMLSSINWVALTSKRLAFWKSLAGTFASRDTFIIIAMLGRGYSCGPGVMLRRPGISLKQLPWVDIWKTKWQVKSPNETQNARLPSESSHRWLFCAHRSHHSLLGLHETGSIDLGHYYLLLTAIQCITLQSWPRTPLCPCSFSRDSCLFLPSKLQLSGHSWTTGAY